MPLRASTSSASEPLPPDFVYFDEPLFPASPRHRVPPPLPARPLGPSRPLVRGLKLPRLTCPTPPGKPRRRRTRPPLLLEIENFAKMIEDFKVMLVVRDDLKMQPCNAMLG